MVPDRANCPQWLVFEQVIDERRSNQGLLATVLVPGTFLPERNGIVDRGLDPERTVIAALVRRQVLEDRPEEGQVAPLPCPLEGALTQLLGGEGVQLVKGHRTHAAEPSRLCRRGRLRLRADGWRRSRPRP